MATHRVPPGTMLGHRIAPKVDHTPDPGDAPLVKPPRHLRMKSPNIVGCRHVCANSKAIMWEIIGSQDHKKKDGPPRLHRPLGRSGVAVSYLPVDTGK